MIYFLLGLAPSFIEARVRLGFACSKFERKIRDCSQSKDRILLPTWSAAMHNSSNKESFCMRKVFSWIPDSLSLGLGFQIPIAGGIPDSLNCNPDSKAQDPDSKQKYPGFPNLGRNLLRIFFWYTKMANVRRGLLIGFFQPFIVLYNNVAPILMCCIIIWPPFTLPHFRNNITGVTSCDFDVRQCAFLHSSGFLKPCMACHARYAKFS